MSYWQTLAAVVAGLFVFAGLVLGTAILILNYRTRSGANPGGGKSAGYARRGAWSATAAAASVRRNAEAADNGPGERGRALSGTTPTCYCAMQPWLDGRHDPWCNRFSPLAAAAANVKDVIDEHIDTAAALLQPDSTTPAERQFAQDVSSWLASGAPKSWTPPPVVPGGES